MYTKFQMGITLISVILILSGCQSSPATTPALSKNDSSFPTNAALSTVSMPSEKKVLNYHYEDTFKSSDESVDFTFHIHEKIEAGDMPIVEVTPHYWEIMCERCVYRDSGTFSIVVKGVEQRRSRCLGSSAESQGI